MAGLAFAELEHDFLRITAATVFRVATTVDERGRPRSRMLHPIFTARDGRPLGSALTGRTPLKPRHLAANPHMSCSFWTPSHDTAFVDCRTGWVEGDAEKQHVWWRVQVMTGDSYATGRLTGRVWRAP